MIKTRTITALILLTITAIFIGCSKDDSVNPNPNPNQNSINLEDAKLNKFPLFGITPVSINITQPIIVNNKETVVGKIDIVVPNTVSLNAIASSITSNELNLSKFAILPGKSTMLNYETQGHVHTIVNVLDNSQELLHYTVNIKKEKDKLGYIKTIDFSSSVSSLATIDDFDVENGYLYFIHKIGIYRINLNSDENKAEFIIKDDLDWPDTLKVIGNNLYYQGSFAWAISDDIKQVNLNSISAGVQSTYPVRGVSRSQLCKNVDKLYYISSVDAIAPIYNFYELNPSTTHPLIATDEYISRPENMRMINQYLYFSSDKEIRRFDLNKPSEKSSIVYTVPKQENTGSIRGFDIQDNIIYYTLESSNKLYSKDLGIVNQEPKVLGINNNKDGVGYGKLILSKGMLYVKKLTDSQLDVYRIK